MFRKIASRVSIGLAAALVVGSVALADVGTAHAQNTKSTTPTTQATSGQPGYYGNGYGYPCPVMTGSGYAKAAYRGNGHTRGYGMGGCPMMGGGMGMMGGGTAWNRW